MNRAGRISENNIVSSSPFPDLNFVQYFIATHEMVDQTFERSLRYLDTKLK